MKETIKALIDKVLTDMEDIGIKKTDEAAALIFETGNAESGYRHLEQIGGPAKGFFQIEGWVIKDCWDNYIVFRKSIQKFLEGYGFDPDNMEFCLTSNIALQIAFCRICYRRKPGSIPKDIEGRAAYWKKHYNTPLGRGTVEHYLEAN